MNNQEPVPSVEMLRARKDLASLHRVEFINLIARLPEELIIPLHQFWDKLPKALTAREHAEKYFKSKGGADNVTVTELSLHLINKGHTLTTNELIELFTQEGGE